MLGVNGGGLARKANIPNDPTWFSRGWGGLGTVSLVFLLA